MHERTTLSHFEKCSFLIIDGESEILAFWNVITLKLSYQ